MQLSQFNSEATIGDDGRVAVSGLVALETDERGRAVPRRHPVRFHFLVVQNGKVLSGDAESRDETWSGFTTDPDPAFSAGPALAIGLAVEVLEEPTPTLRTSTWAEDITLKSSG
jgi:hypothetical protein